MGDVKLVDSMMLDGLIDAFHGYHMGITGKSIDLIFFLVRTLLISYNVSYENDFLKFSLLFFHFLTKIVTIICTTNQVKALYVVVYFEMVQIFTYPLRRKDY